MNEDAVEWLAQLIAMVLEAEAIKANIEGMKTENAARAHAKLAQAWPSHCFFEAEQELQALAAKIRDEF